MKRYAVFSDIHGNVQALQAIISDIKRASFTETVCLGDTIAIGPSSAKCLDLIIQNKVKMLAGNHELYYLYGTAIDGSISENEKAHQRWVKESLSEVHRQFVDSCELEYSIGFHGKKIGFCHYLIADRKRAFPFFDSMLDDEGSLHTVLDAKAYDLLICGHEHRERTIGQSDRQMYCIESSGCVKSDSTCYYILEVPEKGRIQLQKRELKYDREEFVADVMRSNYPDRNFIAGAFFGIEAD